MYGAVPPDPVHVNVIDCPTSAAARGELALAARGAGGEVTVTPWVCATLLPPRESEAVTNGE
ncbi:hypothetical protein AUG86_02655 [Euryarchaeota archaeon 13_1_20CM_4_64_14]|nr:MAG: hypothetical protein AUG86_02655 [Euryarchaeota archaeon 13_1_20CM_4_64_14]